MVGERHAKWASNGRLKYSIQIYDTMHSFNDPQHVKALAEHIHKATLETRCGDAGQDYDDRLGIYGLVMPSDTPHEERVKRCIAHQKAEIIACNSAGQPDLGDV